MSSSAESTVPVRAFELQAKDSSTAARAGLLRTAHTTVETPVFMPVATLGSIKGVERERLLSPAINAQLLLANAYHLYLRPGLEVIRKAGGLRAFMGWPQGLLTDSGGYQIFSLSSGCRISEEGVQFRDPVNGDSHNFTPKLVVELQRILGADIIVPLDECTPYNASRSYQQEALSRTQRWLSTSLQHLTDTSAHSSQLQLFFPIIQGGMEEDLRKSAARTAVSLEADGYAVGGLSVGEPVEDMYRVLEWICPILPAESPRYLMGVGSPQNLLEAIARGVDMFDCVMPTRNGRNGMLFTTEGILNIRNTKWRSSQEVLDAGLNNPISQGYSRSYLRHLSVSGERLAEYLASVQNLAFYAYLMRSARGSYPIGRLSSLGTRDPSSDQSKMLVHRKYSRKTNRALKPLLCRSVIPYSPYSY